MFEFIKEYTTDWSVCRIYKIDKKYRFTVTWQYGGTWFERFESTNVTQIASYVKVVKRRKSGELFDVQILDEDECTIRGKHCIGNESYIKLCQEASKL